MKKKSTKSKKNGALDMDIEEFEHVSQNHNFHSDGEAPPKNAKGTG